MTNNDSSLQTITEANKLTEDIGGQRFKEKGLLTWIKFSESKSLLNFACILFVKYFKFSVDY